MMIEDNGRREVGNAFAHKRDIEERGELRIFDKKETLPLYDRRGNHKVDI